MNRKKWLKLIFLDIDWVLIRFGNTSKIRKTRADKWDKWWLITSLDEDLVNNLVKIVNETKCRIVLSSSWRNNDKLKEILHKQLMEYKTELLVSLSNMIIGQTPSYLNHWRGNEVLTWLNEYHKTCEDWEYIQNWVMIDDDDFDAKCIKRLWRFVHTKTNQWLTLEKTEEVINILNR